MTMTARCAGATNPVAPGTASVIPPSKTQAADIDKHDRSCLMSGRVPAGPRRGCGVAHSVPVPLLWFGPRRPDPASAVPRSAGPKSAELVDLVESLVSRCAVGQLMALDDLAVAESDNDVASGGEGQVVSGQQQCGPALLSQLKEQVDDLGSRSTV